MILQCRISLHHKNGLKKELHKLQSIKLIRYQHKKFYHILMSELIVFKISGSKKQTLKLILEYLTHFKYSVSILTIKNNKNR